jgi:putative FmdB family regulatory protein
LNQGKGNMPTYEYECKSCGHGFEVFQSMSDDPLKDCPECGRELRRIINGGSGVIFKGSGFYVTDKGSSKQKAEKPKAGEGKTDGAKSEAPAACASCPAAAASGGTCPSEKAAG